MSNWQTIESAPKEEKDIWLYEGNTTKKTWRGAWSPEFNEWVFGVASDDHTVLICLKLKPTHWMPVPELPCVGSEHE